MANISFGQNILPKVNNTYSLGNSDKKWNLYVNEINGTALSSLIPDVSGFYTKPSGGIPATDLAETYLTASTEKWSDYTISLSTTTAYTSTLTILVKNNDSITTHVASKTPTADYIPIYDNSAYLNSTTPSSGDNSTKVATTAFVQTAISGLGSGGSSGLPSVSSTDNGKILSVSEGTWSAITPNYLTSHQDISGLAPKANPEFTGSISLGRRTIGTGTNAFTCGYNLTATGDYSTAIGYSTSATGEAAHAEGVSYEGAYTAPDGISRVGRAAGKASHTEGYYTGADGVAAHAEGNQTFALGPQSHSEGILTIAGGQAAHTNGRGTIATGAMSWVGGVYNVYESANAWTANTSYSVGDKVLYNHALRKCKTANSDSSFDETKWTYNATWLFQIGNGTAESRSNALTITSDGNGLFNGDLYVNCDADSTNGDKVATESYVTTAIANASFGGGSGSGLPSVSSSDNGKILQVSSGAWSIITPNFLTSHQDISGKANSADLATVATSGDYGDLLNKPDLSQYLTSVPTMVGATSSAAGTAGLAPAPTSADVDKFLAGDGTYKSGGLPMVILSYGSSTWAQFEAAYNNNVIVYARASSNANPATGSQTRMAFMAYVNNATTPTEVEFQYYRSMSSHSATAMGDQVFVYKLTKTGGWSVTTRDASIKEIKIDSSSSGTVSWSSNVVTLKSGLPKVTASDDGKILKVVNGVWTAVSPE